MCDICACSLFKGAGYIGVFASVHVSIRKLKDLTQNSNCQPYC